MFLGLFLGACPLLQAQPAAVDEARLKLVYLFQFMQFVDWPPATLPADGPMRLCVQGAHPFGGDLEALAGRMVKGRGLQIAQVERSDELANCQVVYAERLPARLLERLRGRPVLLVSAESGSAQRGATIEFVVQASRLRWMLNLDSARQSGLRVSAKLIELSLPLGAEQAP